MVRFSKMRTLSFSTDGAAHRQMAIRDVSKDRGAEPSGAQQDRLWGTGEQGVFSFLTRRNVGKGGGVENLRFTFAQRFNTKPLRRARRRVRQDPVITPSYVTARQTTRPVKPLWINGPTCEANQDPAMIGDNICTMWRSRPLCLEGAGSC